MLLTTRSWHALVQSKWRNPALISLFISAIILALFVYSFAFANRYLLFLYTHLNAGPFHEMTNGRYWMMGFVISGLILLLYGIANWYLARLFGVQYKTYMPPSWWRIWLFCLLPLLIGIPLITMTVGQPTLPLDLALLTTVTTLAGLALALLGGSLTANHLDRFLGYGVVGVGFIPSLLMVRFIELPGQGLMDRRLAFLIASASCIVGVVWIITWAGKFKRRFKRPLTITELLTSGFIICYLILPLVHYLFLTPPSSRYITTDDNFFAKTIIVQLVSFLIAFGTAYIVTCYQSLFGAKHE